MCQMKNERKSQSTTQNPLILNKCDSLLSTHAESYIEFDVGGIEECNYVLITKNNQVKLR